jgi:hypothetical protein
MSPVQAEYLAHIHAQGAHRDTKLICPACQAEDYRAIRGAERAKLAQILESAAESKSTATADCLRRIAKELKEVSG